MTTPNPILSQTSEHALRAILYLARAASEEPVSADSIAEALGAPRNYLSKTLNTLAKRGFVSSTRGPFGGFRLAVEPEALTIADVIHAFDEPRHRGICLLGGQPCDDRQPCTVHFRWKAVAVEMWAPLNNTTIADLFRGEIPDRIIAGTGAGTPRRAARAAAGQPRKDEP
jgi:Rrf2 family protein